MTGLSNTLAVVTGASSGIGLELAKCCAKNGSDLLIVADEPKIENAAVELRDFGVTVTPICVDLAAIEGNQTVYSVIEDLDQPVGALLANAGRGLGKAFLDQDFAAVQHIVDTNITGTLYLLHKVGDDMRRRGDGRILITGSIAGFMPGTYQAVYNGTKAFLYSFAVALRHELKGSGVSVTCLMPGATETAFFERADMLDTKLNQSKKDDPAEVARIGFEAMMRRDGDIVAGWLNKFKAAVASVTPSGLLAEMHRDMAGPGSARR